MLVFLVFAVFAVFAFDAFCRADFGKCRHHGTKNTGEGPPSSHFGPEANLLGELAATFAEYGATGSGKLRRYVHDASEAKELGSEPGTFTPWNSMATDSDLLFYEGLHGGYVGGDIDVGRHEGAGDRGRGVGSPAWWPLPSSARCISAPRRRDAPR